MNDAALDLRQPANLELGIDYPQIQTMIRHLSCQRFAAITARPSISIGQDPLSDDFIYGSHLSLIQLAAKELRLTFKAHFTLGDLTSLVLAQAAAQRERPQILRATYDLFKEYSNLVGGAIAQQLHRCEILAGLSLPLATTGFTEVIASDGLRPGRLLDYWRIEGQGFTFVCSVVLDILQSEKLERFEFVDEDQTEGGDIEML